MEADRLFTESGALEVLGHTVLHAQDFERAIGHCAGLVFTHRETLGLSDLTQIKAASQRLTLGKFLRQLAERQTLPPQLEADLDSVLKRRNRMIHHSAGDPEFNLSQEEGCRRFVNFLLHLQWDMTRLMLVFHGFEQAFLSELGVETVARLRQEYPDIYEFIDGEGYELLRREA